MHEVGFQALFGQFDRFAARDFDILETFIVETGTERLFIRCAQNEDIRLEGI